MKKEPTPGIESAATILSHAEIEMIKMEPYRVIIRKLQDLIDNPNPLFDRAIENFTSELAGIDYNLSENKVRGVWYNEKRKTYIAERNHDGKNRYITCSKDFNACLQAYIGYCETHNLNP